MNEASLVAALKSDLSDLPGFEFTGVEGRQIGVPPEIDVAFVAKARGKPFTALVEVKSRGYPSDVERGIKQLDVFASRYRSESGPGCLAPMFVAPLITETSRALLRSHRIGYWDTSGSLYLELPWALYSVERPVPKERHRTLRAVYQGSTAQVLHALLLDPARDWRIKDLAAKAEVAPATAYQTCEYLEQQLWMDKAGAGPKTVRRLTNPGALLEDWSRNHRLDAYQHVYFHRWARRVGTIVADIADAFRRSGVPYAATLSTGALAVAPLATDADEAWFLVPEDAVAHLPDVAEAAGLNPVDSGQNVTFLCTRDRSPLLFARAISGVDVASDVQLYLDLAAWPRRGKEQAAHLRSMRLSY